MQIIYFLKLFSRVWNGFPQYLVHESLTFALLQAFADQQEKSTANPLTFISDILKDNRHHFSIQPALHFKKKIIVCTIFLKDLTEKEAI